MDLAFLVLPLENQKKGIKNKRQTQWEPRILDPPPFWGSSIFTTVLGGTFHVFPICFWEVHLSPTAESFGVSAR